MADIIWADVTAIATELTSIDGAARVYILAYVNGPGVNPDILDGESGPMTRLARIYLAAHIGSGVGKGASGSAGGAVTSESAGGLSRSYAAPPLPPTTPGSHASTDYGRRFDDIIGNSLGRIGFVVP